MSTIAELRAAFGNAWHVNAEAIYALLASDGSAGAGVFTNLTATGNVALGNAVGDTIGLYGVTPVAQRASGSQAAFTAQTYTAIATIAVSAVGTGAFAGVWGFQSSTVAKSIRTQVNKIIVDSVKQNTLLLRMRADAVAIGAIKGAA